MSSFNIQYSFSYQYKYWFHASLIHTNLRVIGFI